MTFIFRTTTLLFLLCATLAPLSAQVSSDRPGQGFSQYTVGKHVLYVQTGFQFGELNLPTPNISSRGNATDLRFGLAKNLEVNFGWTIERGYVDLDPTFPRLLYDTRDAFIGARYTLIDAPDGFIPALAVQARTRVPFSADEIDGEFLLPELSLGMQHLLPANLSLNTYLITDFGGFDNPGTLRYILNLGFPIITNKLNGHVEYYADYSEGNHVGYGDAGLAYLPCEDLQFDLWGGYGGVTDAKLFFVNIGATWRMASWAK